MVIICLFVGMVIGQVGKQISHRFKIPYTPMLVVVGILVGYYADHMGDIGIGIKVWSQMDPHLILLLFLPALIFESAFNSDWHTFKVEIWQVILLAGPLLMASTYLSAYAFNYILGYKTDLSWNAGIILGAIASATDPVAVVSLMKDLGASRRLATLVEGESMLNDGTAMVVFNVVFSIMKGDSELNASVALTFCRLSLGGPLLGLIWAVVLSAWLKRIYNDSVLEVNITIFSSYLLFYVAENTGLKVSGILAMVALGLYMNNRGKTKISSHSEAAVHHVWSYIGYITETVIFLLTGVIVG
jgi:NhaP-type Na+/H+ or K+/H+ antiporter